MPAIGDAVEIYTLVLVAAPVSLDSYIIQGPAPAVHADLNTTGI